MSTDSPYRSLDQTHEADPCAEASRFAEANQGNRADRLQHETAESANDYDELRNIEDEPDAEGSPRDAVAGEEAERSIIDTLKAFGKALLEHGADAHGVGLFLRAAEFAVKVVKWGRFAEGDGTVEISAPIPLGSGVELELSAHPANGRNGPPLTVCCAPSDGWSVGVAEIGPFQVGPSMEHEPAHLHSGHAGEADVPGSEQLPQRRGLGSEHMNEATAEVGGPSHSDVGLDARGRPFEVISADLSTEERDVSRREGLVALERAAQQKLPQLRSLLRGRGTKLGVLYDPEIRRVLWLRLDEDGDSSVPAWRIRIEVDPATGRLSKPDVRKTPADAAELAVDVGVRPYARPMTDESASAEPRAADPLATTLDRPLTELTVDELMALKAEFEARGIRFYNSASPEQLVLFAGTAIYSKAFLETLAKHNAEELIHVVRTRFRKNGKATELLVGPDDDAAATLVITSDTPDEARLAVLDLDVTAEDVRGRLLRWDAKAGTWRPSGTED